MDIGGIDTQSLFNTVSGGSLAVGGWFARELWTAVQELRQDLSRLREELPKVYTTRADSKDDMRELKSLLERIDLKLDHKVDKG